MAEAPDRQQLLREEFHSQTARISWHDLQTHYARGNVILVATDLDLVDVAVQLGMDNTDQFQRWIDNKQVASVQPDQAQLWFDSNILLWTVVAPPWVLVQKK
ncbi:MAG: DUF2288 domain-containing protein [Halieaceae bacterium]|jgi:hypothetical protein|nr:DUF2288 domain-containing protein [Halieaceae bacterium]